MNQSRVAAAGIGQQLSRTGCGREIAGMDWARAGVTSPDGWPLSLSALVLTMLDCPAPMIVGWGPDLSCFFNDAYRTVLGARAESAMGRPFRELWRGDWSEIAPLVDEALGGTGRKASEVALGAHDGESEESWWDFTFSPVRDDLGDIAGLLCVASERTDQVLAERTRKEAADRLRSALSAGIPIGAWDWDVVNDRIYSESEFALYYRVEPERAALGSPLEEFLSCIHPEDRERLRAEIDATLSSGLPFLSEYRIVGPSGDCVWVSAQGTPVLDEEGRCVRLPGLTFDITASKLAESRARMAA